VKLQERYSRVMGPIQLKPKMRDYFRDASNVPQARLRFLFRSGCVGVTIETGRYSAVDRADRLCPFCTANVVEDGTHFLVSCSAWARQRTKLTEFFRTQLSGIKAVADEMNLDAFMWWSRLREERQADLLVGGPLPTADLRFWSRGGTCQILDTLYTAFNRFVWRMWMKRTRLALALADASVPTPPSVAVLPPLAVGADGQPGAV